MTDVRMIANFSKILADPIKLRIIKVLKGKNLSSSEIQDMLELSQSYTSLQLKHLVKEGVVTCSRDGKMKIYQIANNQIIEIITNIRDFIIQREKEKLGKISQLEKKEF